MGQNDWGGGKDQTDWGTDLLEHMERDDGIFCTPDLHHAQHDKKEKPVAAGKSAFRPFFL